MTEGKPNPLGVAFILAALSAIIFWICATVACGAEPPKAPECWCPATITALPDVDTAWLRIRLPFSGLVIDGKDGRGIKCRIQGFDGWEASKARIQREPFRSFTAAQWADEIRRGRAATAALLELAKGKRVYVREYEGPEAAVYGRTSVWLKVVDADGKETLVDVWAKEQGHDRGGSSEDDE